MLADDRGERHENFAAGDGCVAVPFVDRQDRMLHGLPLNFSGGCIPTLCG